MKSNEILFKTILSQHISEKSSILIEKNNRITLKVSKYANKRDIKNAILNLFRVKVLDVKTLLTKKKSKKYRNILGYRKNFKKAYITIEKGYNLDLIDNKDFKPNKN